MSAQFCLGRLKFGRFGWIARQHGGSSKSINPTYRSQRRWFTLYACGITWYLRNLLVMNHIERTTMKLSCSHTKNQMA